MDIALTLHADHELNASTFAVRVVASTRASLYRAVSAGIVAAAVAQLLLPVLLMLPLLWGPSQFL